MQQGEEFREMPGNTWEYHGAWRVVIVWMCVMQAEYHKEYEASKGTMISVAEDPEMMRMKQVTNVISQASYSGHGRDADAGWNCACF